MRDNPQGMTKTIQEFLSRPVVIVCTGILVFAFSFFSLSYGIYVLVDIVDQIFSAHTLDGFSFPSLFSFREDWKGLYVILGVFSAAVAFRMSYQLRKAFEPLNHGQEGDRQFATVSELKKQYRSVPEKTETYRGKGGFPISRYENRIFIDDSPVNNLIIGTSRSGKGELYVFPAIDIYSRAKKQINRPSMVINDPKGELAAASKETLEKRGYLVQIFDLLTFQGLFYNPLEIIKDAYLSGDISTAQTLTNSLSYIMFHNPTAKDKTWEEWNIQLSNALIFAILIDSCAKAEKAESPEEKAAIYAQINLYSAARLLIDLGEVDEKDSKNKLDRFFRSRPCNDYARMQYASVEQAPGKTKGSIYANALGMFNKFTMQNVAKMTSRNTIDLKSIGFDTKRPTAVFLVTPDYDLSNYFIVTIFLSQLYFMLSKTATLVSKGVCPRQVVFLLDEFGNIPTIPYMSNIITVCLGRNIRFTLIVQAYSQIENLYGKSDYKTIVGNCGNQIYLLSIDWDTAKYFSNLIGPKTITVQSRSGDPLSLDKHFHENIKGIPLLNPNDLMELTPGESVVVRVTKRRDRRGRVTPPSPIFNHDETLMKHRYEYLSEFGADLSFADVVRECDHQDVDLESIVFHPEIPDEEQSEAADVRVVESLTEHQITILQALTQPVILHPEMMTATELDNALQVAVERGNLNQAHLEDVHKLFMDTNLMTDMMGGDDF